MRLRRWTRDDTIKTIIPAAIGLIFGLTFGVWHDLITGREPWEMKLARSIYNYLANQIC